MLSVECPFHDESILEVGTKEKSKEVYAKTIASGDTLYAGCSISRDTWTHVVMVWKPSAQALLIYVHGALSKAIVLGKAEQLAFVQSNKSWRVVPGRGKSGGKTRHGWDGVVRVDVFLSHYISLHLCKDRGRSRVGTRAGRGMYLSARARLASGSNG